MTGHACDTHLIYRLVNYVPRGGVRNGLVKRLQPNGDFRLSCNDG
jgi:hypothetical protein